MVEKFRTKSGNDRGAVVKLNKIVDVVNSINNLGNQSSSGDRNHRNRISLGQIDTELANDKFTGTFLGYDGNPVASTSPFYQVQVDCCIAEKANVEVGKTFLALRYPDGNWYCVAVFGSGGGGPISVESTDSLKVTCAEGIPAGSFAILDSLNVDDPANPIWTVKKPTDVNYELEKLVVVEVGVPSGETGIAYYATDKRMFCLSYVSTEFSSSNLFVGPGNGIWGPQNTAVSSPFHKYWQVAQSVPDGPGGQMWVQYVGEARGISVWSVSSFDGSMYDVTLQSGPVWGRHFAGSTAKCVVAADSEDELTAGMMIIQLTEVVVNGSNQYQFEGQPAYYAFWK